MEELKGTELTCDYVVSSGAEVRNPQQEVVKSTPISIELCEEVYNTAKKYPVSVAFFTDRYDYRIGTKKEIEDGIIQQIRLFNMDIDTSEEIVRKSPQYRRIAGNTKGISDIRSLESSGAPVYKIFIFAAGCGAAGRNSAMSCKKIQPLQWPLPFIYNQEITAVEAQKGPVLKEYIESLGYTMDEVMVLGDSLNDYSMISMDFGATVAMGNAVPEIKEAAKYITKSNNEFGVAYAIDQVLIANKNSCA